MMKTRNLILIGTGLLLIGGLPIARSSTIRSDDAATMVSSNRAQMVQTQVVTPAEALAPAVVDMAPAVEAGDAVMQTAAVIERPAAISSDDDADPAELPAPDAVAPKKPAKANLAAPANLPRANSQAMITAATPMVPPVAMNTGTTNKIAKAMQAAVAVTPTPAVRNAPAPGVPAARMTVPPTQNAQRGAPARPAATLSVAPTAAVAAAAAPARPAPKVAAGKAGATNVRAAGAMAPAAGPRTLFSYVRLLNYSPHPTNECFLQKEPIMLGANRYHFEIDYKEGWKTFNDEEGALENIGFVISLFENGNKVRTLETPTVKLDPKKIGKGKVLGIAEVAPYRFNITVDSATVKQGGITELVFKLDLITKS